MSRILVAYASKHNSTAEIAREIGEVLRWQGTHSVDVMSAGKVTSISGYDAVVLGSAVYMGQWMPDAADFLKTFERQLADRPTWIFSSGPTSEGDPTTLTDGWTFPETLQPVADRIHPRDMAIFSGKLNPIQLGLFERFMLKLIRPDVGDFRDWKMIRAWADKILRSVERLDHVAPTVDVDRLTGDKARRVGA
jgi:menaquinone-dependent protoporphyrinogen oxidase